ncbi:MAG: hypothetical protein AAF557_01345 [Pseudomonadota bacterium]
MTRFSRMSRIIGQFVRDERGSITLEFVLWLPFLLFWVIFSLAVFLAMDNRYDAAKATYTISDVVSRFKENLTRDRLVELQLLMHQLLPNSTQGMMRLSSVEFDQGAYTVQWTACFGGDAVLGTNVPPMTDDQIPLNLVPAFMDDKDTVIVTETFTPYFPISDFWVPSSLAWQIGVVTRPRFVAKIDLDDDLQDALDNCRFAPPET